MGRKKLTKEEFVERAKVVHKDKYTYDKFVYIHSQTKGIITCPFHGDYEQSPDSHLRGVGCPKCKGEKNSDLKRSNLEEFIEKAKIIHKDKYSYDKFVYTNSKVKGIITCDKHGEFEQSPNNHLSGKGCPKCAGEKNSLLQRSNLEEFVEKAKKVHNNFYDYSNVEYINNNKKIKIICPIHGEFEQSPNNHLSGKGCPKCAIEYCANLKRSNLEKFIERAKITHKDSKCRYIYDKFIYQGANIKSIITCEKHGDFKQKPSHHLSGHGCPKCRNEKTVERNRIKWSDRYSEGFLYLIECWNDVERFIKIGVTSKTVEERYRQFGSMPYQYKILKEIYSDSNTVSDTEQHIINFYESYKPKITFGGDTECFCIDEKHQIIQFLENLEKRFGNF